MAENIKAFFEVIEDVWEAIPGYVKVFFYSVISSSVGLWVAGDLDWRAVTIILFTNLGLYTGPRAINKIMK